MLDDEILENFVEYVRDNYSKKEKHIIISALNNYCDEHEIDFHGEMEVLDDIDILSKGDDDTDDSTYGED
jgi:hypothetical protein